MIKGTNSGQMVNLLDPNPNTIRIKDIALGLSNIRRWGGQLQHNKAITVAQHSVLCSYHAKNKESQYACLMHDAAEYLIGDIFPPLKAYYGMDELESNILQVIFEKYKVPYDQWQEVHTVDKQALLTEHRDLLNVKFELGSAYEYYEPWLEPISVWHSTVAYKKFLNRFKELRLDNE